MSRWKIDKQWVIPNTGKLELLYLESQIYCPIQVGISEGLLKIY
jgi:hypothetical protein